MTTNDASIHISVPPAKIGTLTFTDSKPSAVEEWADSLPLTNLNKCAKFLYPALQEISTLITTPEIRFAMLESVRIRSQTTIEGLSKHFLSQSLVLPPEVVKIATLAQAMQKYLNNGYKLVISELLNANDTPANRSLMSLAIYHAIKGISFFMLRCHQLYLPLPPNLWQELHSLYLLAENRGLVHAELEDQGNKYHEQSNIVAAYLRAVMLECAKPNKLRQADLERVFHCVEIWLVHIDFHHDVNNKEKTLFVIPMTIDSPPIYTASVNGEIGDDYRFISMDRLTKGLKGALQKDKCAIEIPQELTLDVVEHLVEIWSVQKRRSFDRNPAKDFVEVCIGLKETHFYCAGEIAFDDFLDPSSKAVANKVNNPFLTGAISRDKHIEVDDVWDEVDRNVKGNTSVSVSTSEIEQKIRERSGVVDEVEVNKHGKYKLSIVNASPGGFCLKLGADVPARITTGEIIGLRESGQDNWSIGIIRWMRQSKEGSQIGVELLSPSALPCGASIVKKTGLNTEFLRVLVLPELKFINQPATLITSQLLFQEGSKINLKKEGQVKYVQLTKRLFTTGSINQFEFRLIEKIDDSGDK